MIEKNSDQNSSQKRKSNGILSNKDSSKSSKQKSSSGGTGTSKSKTANKERTSSLLGKDDHDMMAPDEFFNLQAYESDSSFNHFEKINNLSKKKKSEKNNKILPKR